MREYTKESLISHIGVVMQKARLFKGTIKSNMLVANKDADDNAIWESLKCSQAKEFF